MLYKRSCSGGKIGQNRVSVREENKKELNGSSFFGFIKSISFDFLPHKLMALCAKRF